MALSGTASAVDTVGNNQNTTYQIQGVVSVFGGALAPGGRPAFISQRTNTPKLLVPAVPFGGQKFWGYTNSANDNL